MIFDSLKKALDFLSDRKNCESGDLMLSEKWRRTGEKNLRRLMAKGWDSADFVEILFQERTFGFPSEDGGRYNKTLRFLEITLRVKEIYKGNRHSANLAVYLGKDYGHVKLFVTGRCECYRRGPWVKKRCPSTRWLPKVLTPW